MSLLTAKDIIARKTDLVHTGNETVDIDVDGVGTCRFAIPTASDIDDVYAWLNAHNEPDSKFEIQMAYQQMVEPDLHDPELVATIAEAIGKDVATATSGSWMLMALFKVGQIHSMAGLISQKAGFNDGTVAVANHVAEGAEAVKN